MPYMGLGTSWPEPTRSWDEKNYSNLCINACWELYGATDREHLPASGARYDVRIAAPAKAEAFPWVSQWDEDEGKGKTCATSTIHETHDVRTQHVLWNISGLS